MRVDGAQLLAVALSRQVFFDGDAFVNEPSTTLPDMLQRWGFHDRASLLFGETPQDGVSNFGFGIVRRTDVALDALQRTLDCPNDYADCAKLATELCAWLAALSCADVDRSRPIGLCRLHCSDAATRCRLHPRAVSRGQRRLVYGASDVLASD